MSSMRLAFKRSLSAPDVNDAEDGESIGAGGAGSPTPASKRKKSSTPK